MTPATIPEVLNAAAALIEPEGAWLQGCYAKDSHGNHMMHGDSDDAVCWCAIGALDRAAGRGSSVDPGQLWMDSAKAFAESLEWRNGLNDTITTFNDADGRTQSEVVSALRNAAAMAVQS